MVDNLIEVINQEIRLCSPERGSPAKSLTQKGVSSREICQQADIRAFWWDYREKLDIAFRFLYTLWAV